MKQKKAFPTISVLFLVVGAALAAWKGKTVFDKAAWEDGRVLTALIAAGMLFFILFGVVGLILFFLRRSNGTSKIDTNTGLLTRKGIAAQYRSISAGLRKYMNTVYLAYDPLKLYELFDAEKCAELEKTAGAVIASEMMQNDLASRLEEGSFLLVLDCRDGVHANSRVTELVNKLNDHATRLVGDAVVSFRAGIRLAEKGKHSIDETEEKAEIAYRYAVENGLSVMTCTKELLVMEEAKRQMRALLECAIDNGQFDMFLQLIYDVKQEKFTAAEVLSRWNKPDEGYVMPAYYISNMHMTGVIEKFDQYMLDKTFAQLQKWNGTEFGDLVLSCNITRASISSPDFLKMMQKSLKKYKFDHSRLIMEITEDSFVGNQSVARENVEGIRAEGFRVAIDDFGTGASSLSDLSNYPVDQIKLDRDLIVNTTTKRGKELFASFVRFAHEMDVEVVCEGVETEKQKNVAISSGVDLIQGYLFSYVLDIDEASKHYLESLQK